MKNINLPLVYHRVLRHSTSQHVTDTGNRFSEVLLVHRDKAHAYTPDICRAILHLFWVCHLGELNLPEP